MRIFFLETFGFQEPVTPIMEGIVDLHNQIMFYFDSYFNFCIIYVHRYSFGLL